MSTPCVVNPNMVIDENGLPFLICTFSFLRNVIQQLCRWNTDNRICPELSIVWKLNRYRSVGTDAFDHSPNSFNIGPKLSGDRHISCSNTSTSESLDSQSDVVGYLWRHWTIHPKQVLATQINGLV